MAINYTSERSSALAEALIKKLKEEKGVDAIAPGMIMTDMLRGVNQDELRALAATIPQGYIGEPSDIAGCMEYILTAPYLTGQTISPNGGFVMP